MILRILLTGTTLLSLALAASVGAELAAAPHWVPITGLENVRAYAASPRVDGRSYAVDGGLLYAGIGGAWELIAAPPGVIVNTVTVDRADPDTVYIGAANRLSVFVSRDAGQRWMEIPMDSEAIGGVTALAFDAANRLLYVGTDTDGVFRLREVRARTGWRGGGGRNLIASGHLLLEDPVQEIATDSTGAGLAFVRTQEKLYRAEAFGLRWVAVDSLPAPPTAVAVADTTPPKVYAGTAAAGVVVSRDGIAWRSISQGLGRAFNGPIVISDLAVDAAQPELIYAGTSLFDTDDLRLSPSRVAMSADGGVHWSTLAEFDDVQVAELLPVTGRTGRIYALTTTSRTPLTVGGPPALDRPEREAPSTSGRSATRLLAWILAGHASATLIILVVDGASSGSGGGSRRMRPGTGGARRREADPAFGIGAAPLG